jgi:hypothetical protein
VPHVSRTLEETSKTYEEMRMTLKSFVKSCLLQGSKRKSISLPHKAKNPEERFCSVIERCAAKWGF